MDPSNKYKPLDTSLLKDLLKDSIFKGNLIYKEHLDSTNRYAKELSENGAQEGTVVVAEYQSAGRGRMTRRWLAEPRTNLLFSVLLRPKASIKELFIFNCTASVAIVEGLWEVCRIGSGIKWPNDIYVGGKKIAGILAEFSIKSAVVEYVVIGIGLNVNWAPDQVGAGPEGATSVLAESGKRVCRTRLLASILLRLGEYYHMVVSGNKKSLLDTYRNYSMVLGRKVKIIDGGKTLQARAIDIREDGTLVVESEQGVLKFLKWGDVSLRL